MIIQAIISVVVGFVVGMFSGLVGVGGGSLLVPIFAVCFGMPPVMATGTSLFTIIFTSVAGVGARLRNHTCHVKTGVLLGLGGALSSPIGSYLAALSPEICVVVAVAAVIIYSAATTLHKAIKVKPAQTGSSVSVLLGQQWNGLMSLKCLGIGLLTGIASGYVGLGGGFIMVPLMCNWLGASMKIASGTSLLAIILIAAAGSVAQFMFGNVDVLVGLMVACGSIPGAFVGGTLASRFNDRVLRFVFAGFLFVAAGLLVVRQLGIF